ncbi:hypothetical protein [Thermogymnomonas acidicola]|uniref:hypothetical protein n=1 Tax=Thermogymnomonas acidicola TaxID=399579 RepID=UPI00094679FC|nr:hypothetical protein [Thermogymnomonas acidicola]
MIAAILTVTSYSVPFVVLVAFLPIYAISVVHVQRTLAYSLFVFFFLTSFGMRLYLSFRPVKVLTVPVVLSTSLTVAGLLMLYLARDLAGIIASALVLGIPHGLNFPMSTIMLSRGGTGLSERNVAFSYFSAYNNIVQVVTGLAFGYIVSALGYRLSFLILTAAVGGAPFLAFLILYVRPGGHTSSRGQGPGDTGL